MTWVNVKGVITWKQVSSSPTEAHQTLWTTEEWLWLIGQPQPSSKALCSPKT